MTEQTKKCFLKAFILCPHLLCDVMIVSRTNLFKFVKLFLKLLTMHFINVTCGQASEIQNYLRDYSSHQMNTILPYNERIKKIIVYNVL